MKTVVLKETSPDERRVALVPESAAQLIDLDLQLAIESGAGQAAYFSDDDYRDAGATILDDPAAACEAADLVIKVSAPAAREATDERAWLTAGTIFVGLAGVLGRPAVAADLAERQVTLLSMDAIPRIARAQSMDALSSMSSLGGYKAALIAANELGKYLPMMMTAAGTIPPAQGLVLGAGVAGLQAIATARRLGSEVDAFDIRPEVKEQVESLGARFVEVDYGQDTEDEGGYAKELRDQAQKRQREAIHDRIVHADFVITTALIPGRPAPILVTEAMVEDMAPGAVIVDMAARTGGNCVLTEPGETVTRSGVTIHGPLNLPSTMPRQASILYSRNVTNFLTYVVDDGQVQLDFDDEVMDGACVTHDGEVRSERVRDLLKDDAATD